MSLTVFLLAIGMAFSFSLAGFGMFSNLDAKGKPIHAAIAFFGIVMGIVFGIALLCNTVPKPIH